MVSSTFDKDVALQAKISGQSNFMFCATLKCSCPRASSSSAPTLRSPGSLVGTEFSTRAPCRTSATA